MPRFFTPATISFLRALKRNNDRDWFKAHQEQFERDVKAPLTDLIAALADEFQSYAPDLACSPRESMYRQHRDTRFTEDKSPLKTHVAAVFPSRKLGRKGGAVLYLQIGYDEVWMGGGLYHAPAPALYSVRRHIADNLTRFRSLVESPSFKRKLGGLLGDRLQRVPKGFAADHPAAEYLRYKDLVVLKTSPASFAATPRFYPTLTGIFRDAAPFVRFINEAFQARAGQP